MLKKILSATAVSLVLLTSTAALADTIFVPFQGAWGDGGANSFVFENGDTTQNGWVLGTLLGGGGASNRYEWDSTGPNTGVFYFDTAQGHQGPIYVSFQGGNQMTWQFGGQTTVLHKA